MTSHKELKKARMWKYFVNAATELIEKDGIQQVTIRKVADKAGFNSATLYNYFSEFSHLLFFASMRFMKPYTKEISIVLSQKSESHLRHYVKAWECFTRHSFQTPDIFHAIFMMDLGEEPDTLIAKYYEFFPTEIVDVPEELKPILMERSMHKRGRSFLKAAVQSGEISSEDADFLNDATTLIWQGMFSDVMNRRRLYTAEEATKVTLALIEKLIMKFER